MSKNSQVELYQCFCFQLYLISNTFIDSFFGSKRYAIRTSCQLGLFRPKSMHLAVNLAVVVHQFFAPISIQTQKFQKPSFRLRHILSFPQICYL